MNKGPKGERTKYVIRRGSVVTRVYRFERADGREVFTSAWHASGRRFTRQFATFAQAHADAQLKAEQLAAGRIDAAATVKIEDADVLAEARRLCRNVPILSAIAEWAKGRALVGGSILPACEAWKAKSRGAVSRATVSAALNRFLIEKKKAGYATEDNHGSIFKDVEEAFGNQQIAQVSASALDAYLAKIGNAVTRNTHRKRILTLWRWAQSKHMLPRDTKTEAELTSRAREHAPEVGIISATTFSEVLELIRAKAPEDLPALVLAGFCGLRRGEIHGQTWADVNLKEKFVRVTKAKRGTPARRLVPLSDAAVEWLMLAPDKTEDICTGMAIDRVRKVGIEAKHKLPDNCFRHSYISHRVAETGNVPQTSLDAGNSVQIIHRHYRELVTKDEGATWFAIRPKEKPEAGADVVGMDGKAVANV